MRLTQKRIFGNHASYKQKNKTNSHRVLLKFIVLVRCIALKFIAESRKRTNKNNIKNNEHKQLTPPKELAEHFSGSVILSSAISVFQDAVTQFAHGLLRCCFGVVVRWAESGSFHRNLVQQNCFVSQEVRQLSPTP